MNKKRKTDEEIDLDNYNEKDQYFLKKRSDYEKFLESKKILNNRIISLEDIIQCDITSEKRANLIERYEILQQISPHTSEFIEYRNQLRNLFQKYTNQRPISEDPDIDQLKKKISNSQFKPVLLHNYMIPSNKYFWVKMI